MTPDEAEMLVRHISWLNVYCLELRLLEQPEMPAERHQRTIALRGNAPQFFWLVSSLLKDALILGLDTILDRDKGGKQLTLEHAVKAVEDGNTKADCENKLSDIRKSACNREIAKARDNLISHTNRAMVVRRDQMSLKADFPHLTIPHLEETLRQVTKLAEIALSRSNGDFWHHDWEGVSKLFEELQPKVAG